MHFNSVTATEIGDYFEARFEEDGAIAEPHYFLVQRQFEFPDNGAFYIESHDTRLCGKCQVRAAMLSRQGLRLEVPSATWKTVEIRFTADDAGYEELRRVLETMFEAKLQQAHRDA